MKSIRVTAGHVGAVQSMQVLGLAVVDDFKGLFLFLFLRLFGGNLELVDDRLSRLDFFRKGLVCLNEEIFLGKTVLFVHNVV